MSCIVMSPFSFLILVICIFSIFIFTKSLWEKFINFNSVFREWIFLFHWYFSQLFPFFCLIWVYFDLLSLTSWCGTFNYCFKAFFLFFIMNIHYYKYPSKPCLESQMLIYIIFILTQFKNSFWFLFWFILWPRYYLEMC